MKDYTVDFKIKHTNDIISDLARERKSIDDKDQELATTSNELSELKRLINKYPTLASLTVFDYHTEKSGEAIKDSGSTREPIHFFMSVNKASNRLGTSNYDSYDDCDIVINADWRVGEFREVMPDNYVDKEYFWRNIYYAGVGYELRVGHPNESLDEATVGISKKDNEDYFDTVRIRRDKKC